MSEGIQKTRAGLLPSTRKLNYEINTKMVESYLQKKINFLCKDNNENINIAVETFTAGTAFYPIIITLPSDVLKDKGNSNSVTTIFDEKNSESTDYIRDDFHRFLASMQYRDDDIKKMFDYKNKKILGISTNNALMMKKLQHSKKLTFGKGADNTIVSMVIDPISIFHDMLKMDDDDRTFKVYIDRVAKIEDNNYTYFVTREIVKSKRNLEKNAHNFFARMRNKVKG